MTSLVSLRKAAVILLVTICTAASAQKSPAPSTGGSDPETDLIKAILMKEVVRIVQGNITAADRENGEINKLIRALSGVSMKDIELYGVCGGSNSEVRKLLGSICGKIN